MKNEQLTVPYDIEEMAVRAEAILMMCAAGAARLLADSTLGGDDKEPDVNESHRITGSYGLIFAAEDCMYWQNKFRENESLAFGLELGKNQRLEREAAVLLAKYNSVSEQLAAATDKIAELTRKRQPAKKTATTVRDSRTQTAGVQ